MILLRAEQSLLNLIDYLWAEARVRQSLLRRLRVTHSEAADDFNSFKARQFCFVTEGSSLIRCAANIDLVSERVRLGLLLHEIGHLAINAFHSDSDDHDDVEVRVDEWVMDTFPEAGYKFADHVYRGVTGRKRKAKSVQQVSKNFARIVSGG